MLRNLAQLQENKYTATGAGICLKYRHKDSGSTGFHSYLCYSYFSTESEPKSCRLVFGLTTTFIRWGLKGSHKSKDGRIFSTHRRSYYPSIWSYEVVMWPRGYLCLEYLDSGWKSQRRKKKACKSTKTLVLFLSLWWTARTFNCDSTSHLIAFFTNRERSAGSTSANRWRSDWTRCTETRPPSSPPAVQSRWSIVRAASR